MKTKTDIIQFLVITAVYILLTVSFARADENKNVNPHWTGKHCAECHQDNLPPKLKYNGDPIKLCTVCHESGHSRVNVHKVPLKPSEPMLKRIPSDWPLYKEAISCFTCHEPRMQMHQNKKLEKHNPNFLRGKERRLSQEFCFNCHLKTNYLKANPHEQLDENGKIIKSKCLFCHKTVPDPETAKSEKDVDFINTTPDICIGCHAGKEKNHPGRADHLIRITGKMTPPPATLPLRGDQIFCGTCHNPHQKGIIKNKKGALGSGNDKFIRAKSTYELCVSCHPDKKIDPWVLPPKQPDFLRKAPGQMVRHKPWEEKKCKFCHSATPFNRKQPEPVELCFREGCHKEKIIDHQFIHEPSVTRNCYFCHESHTAGFDKLLRVNEQKLCYVCHPLLPKHELHMGIINKDKSIHKRFNNYLRQMGLTDSKKCTFCHDPSHKKYIRTIFPGICSDCHIFVNRELSDPLKTGPDIHNLNRDKLCSECHDSHSGDYIYQLKKPAETYKETP